MQNISTPNLAGARGSTCMHLFALLADRPGGGQQEQPSAAAADPAKLDSPLDPRPPPFFKHSAVSAMLKEVFEEAAILPAGLRWTLETVKGNTAYFPDSWARVVSF
ncbi:hypothetical protein PAPYR_9290 [Paratrimastix pyriformis]|uniref:Uncharacterized protein n=1 Tax=Paratrimastix pyriformis TaxID=342808 RepID=A0ABQ8UBA9_9EUKA|nr:hypothetical protein PAPYR_9290 [Paratrimastix pyriformis]